MPAVSLLRVQVDTSELLESFGEGTFSEIPSGLWERLEQVPDPRCGPIFGLPCLLAIALCAMTAAGHDGLTSVGQWIAGASQRDLARLRAPYDVLLERFRAPSETTVRRVVDRIAPEQLSLLLLAPDSPQPPASSPEPGPDLEGVSVDGKSLRGSRTADGKRVHMLGAHTHHHADGLGGGGRLVAQVPVDGKRNETSHFKPLLENVELQGKVVTFDALLTVRANLQWLVDDKHAHYLAVLKKNQPLTHAFVRRLPWAQIPAGHIDVTSDHAHGRDETRTAKVLDLAPLSGLGLFDFPAAAQAVKLTRWRRSHTTGKTSRETVYLITDLTPAQADAADLARLARRHWGIESHHHVRDVSFREDHCRNRTGNGPANLATIRAAIINALRTTDHESIPAARRAHIRPAAALRLHGLLT